MFTVKIYQRIRDVETKESKMSPIPWSSKTTIYQVDKVDIEDYDGVSSSTNEPASAKTVCGSIEKNDVYVFAEIVGLSENNPQRNIVGKELITDKIIVENKYGQTTEIIR